VQEEYGHAFGGDTADKYLPAIGRAGNPRLALSVTARRLGARNMFNAAIINLETGVQEAGDSVDYKSLDDGMNATEALALKFAKLERERLVADPAAQAEWRRLAAQAKAGTLVVRDAAAFAQAISPLSTTTRPAGSMPLPSATVLPATLLPLQAIAPKPLLLKETQASVPF
jgi:hypothetical protein